jgi:hypothetical protein
MGVRPLPLISLNLPSPRSLRGGWAAKAAVCASRGWSDVVYATPREWLFHDGGGNWACLRFQSEGRAVLFGHDHEYSNTYFGAAAEYFDEPETNLLEDAPAWWAQDLSTPPFGEWIGFIYGWDGLKWQRANYDLSDGFENVGLLDSCSVSNLNDLLEHAKDAPGLMGQSPDPTVLAALIAADANITYGLLYAVVPGWDIDAGVIAGRKFLEASP